MDRDLPRKCKVTFARSGKVFTWDPQSGSLLNFAREKGILISSGCLVGTCPNCAVTVLSGEVVYGVRKPFEEPGTGTCVSCIATPAEDIVLDA